MQASSTSASPQTERTRVNPRWIFRVGIIALCLIGFGFWGLYDALVAYPARGRRAATASEYRYLDAAYKVAAQESITDPKGEYQALKQKERDRVTLNAVEQAKLEWLERLDRVSQLDPAFTTIPRSNQHENVSDARTRREELHQVWGVVGPGAKSENPLAYWDIPSQWVIMACGFGIGAFVLVRILRVASRSYEWNPASMALTVPGGAQLTPSDIAEFDKRDWHKYLITLGVRADHPKIPGKRITIDLYHYTKLEEWILAMEKQVKGEPSEAAATVSDAPVGAAGAAAGSSAGSAPGNPA
ncbi:MAG: hypothetical protein SFZ23_12810 [Planctomycetota bacterium]|nr:hypothetical protein [Planctomycetota bacterium]